MTADNLSPMAHARHELLSDVAAHAAAILADHGIDEEIAGQAAFAVADHLAEHWGGQVVSFPKEYFFKLHVRDLQVWECFNGTNHAVLAKQYGMTTRGIYKLLERVKKRELDRRQGKLFPV